MTNLIIAAVLIWIALSYGIWTAIGAFVLYVIVAVSIAAGLYNIAARQEERAEEKAARPPRPRAPLPLFINGPNSTKAKVWRGFTYVVAIAFVSLLATACLFRPA